MIENCRGCHRPIVPGEKVRGGYCNGCYQRERYQTKGKLQGYERLRAANRFKNQSRRPGSK